MTLDELLYKLKTQKYTTDLLGKKTEFNVLNNEEFGIVENLIREYALDNHDSEMGELKAKLYAYEQIIAKSNFAPMLEQQTQISADEWIPLKKQKNRLNILCSTTDIINKYGDIVDMQPHEDVVNTEQTEWIPVSERMPETYQDVIVSLKSGEVYVDKLIEHPFVQGELCWNLGGRIVAWMPLPKPYKAESEE